ncbi:uncharacterized protein N7483_002514 [Penicillium malachiteum]|uniref:uncharacterized protein n=1 Tax=Penicillium malachiteum TaxID=1324776 RepID=UPI002548F332|nr:uncharacterized protein N7483_002514 [Penicillium malachiteum]KAJ5737389.1 hypothetical protein N7483_002514 [Penicillium malachiteum]
MEICNFEEDISNGSRSIFDQEWHFVIRMQNQGDGTLVDPSDIFVESQSYSPDGEAQPDHATSRFSMDESGHLAPLSAHLAPLNAHIDRRLLAPCVSAAMAKTPRIGIPWVMIGNGGGKRFYLAFSIKIATEKGTKLPITRYAKFPEIIPDLICDIETNFFGTRASSIGEAPDVAKYQMGHFGCAESTPAINSCCIEWSEVFMGGRPLIQDAMNAMSSLHSFMSGKGLVPSIWEDFYRFSFKIFSEGVTVGVLRKWRGIMVGDIRAPYKEKPIWWPEFVRYMGPANLERDGTVERLIGFERYDVMRVIPLPAVTQPRIRKWTHDGRRSKDYKMMGPLSSPPEGEVCVEGPYLLSKAAQEAREELAIWTGGQLIAGEDYKVEGQANRAYSQTATSKQRVELLLRHMQLSSETQPVPASSIVVPINVIAGIPEFVDPRHSNAVQRLLAGYFFRVNKHRIALIQLTMEKLVWNEEDSVPKLDYLIVERAVQGRRNR